MIMLDDYVESRYTSYRNTIIVEGGLDYGRTIFCYIHNIILLIYVITTIIVKKRRFSIISRNYIS